MSVPSSPRTDATTLIAGVEPQLNIMKNRASLADIITLMHLRQGYQVQHQYLDGVRNLQYLSPLHLWSGYGGTGVGGVTLRAITSVWKQSFGIDVTVEHDVIAERNGDKQRHLHHEIGPSVITSSVKELVEPRVINCVQADGSLKSTGSCHKSFLPSRCSVFDNGVPCTSRTSLNKNAADNINCVQKGTDATGEGFKDVFDVGDAHWPEVVMIECSDKLAQVDPKAGPTSVSDAVWVTDQYKSKGYWATHGLLQATDWGSYPSRYRYYAGACLRPNGSTAEMDAYFWKVLNSFRMPSLPPEQYITLDDEERREESKYLGIPLHADLGEREPKRGKDDQEWRLEHKTYFDAMKMEWPPMIEDCKSPALHVSYAGMLPREREVANYLMRVFKIEYGVIHFADVNPKLSRILTSCLSPDLTEVKKTPWHSPPDTLVGSMRLVLLYQQDADSPLVMRLVEAFELFRMIGWSDENWRPVMVDADGNGECYRQTHEHLELLSNLCGNAFSIHHYAPWMMSLLATYGRFMCGSLGDLIFLEGNGGERKCVEPKPPCPDDVAPSSHSGRLGSSSSDCNVAMTDCRGSSNNSSNSSS